MKIYLCGPMTGIKDYNYPAFNAEADRLRALDYYVANPAENSVPAGSKWHVYMRMAIGKLLTCDTVAVLPGWRRSKGARLEVYIARALGMQVVKANGIVK